MAKGHVTKSIYFLLALVLFGVSIFYNSGQAHALGTQLFITEVQVNDTEFIEIYNPQSEAVNLSGWKVNYRGSGADETQLKAFSGSDSIAANGFVLLSHGYPVPAGSQSYTFSASLANTAGYVAIYDTQGVQNDVVGWGSGALQKLGSPALVPAVGASIQRCLINGLLAGSSPRDNSQDFAIYAASTPGVGVNCTIPEPIDVCTNLAEIQEVIPAGYVVDGSGNCTPEVVDICPNLTGVQVAIPDGYETGSSGDCTLVPTCLLEISEISSQPNYNGQEYVELFNSSSSAATLTLCKLKINTGSEKTLPDIQIEPGARYVVGYSSGTIRNSAGQVSLIHSNNEEVTYTYPDTLTGQAVNFASGYQGGMVTDLPTPGAPNQLVLLSEEDLAVVVGGGSILESCPAGKYRNPETNRCKNIEALTTALLSCDVGQERNPETNRCRKIGSSTDSLSLCNEGYERNAETNRCRKVTAEADLVPCQPGQERNPETNRCRKVAATATGTALATAASPAAINPVKFSYKIILLITTAVLLYGLYEYRVDARNFLAKVRARFGRLPPPG